MVDDRPIRITIIGGGITGLSSAYRLLELARSRNLAVNLRILEASDRAGGIIWTTHRDGFLLEEGPDNFITNKTWGLSLIGRLGLDHQLLKTNDKHRRAMIVRHGKLVPIPEGFELMAPAKAWPLLKSPIFSLRGKLRMLWERFVTAKKENADESLESFVVRRFGRETLDNLVQALVGGIYTADPKTLSLRATLPRFLDMETEHGSVIKALRRQRKEKAEQKAAGARYSLFVTLKNGMQSLPDALIASLPDNTLQLNTRVASISKLDANQSDNATAAWRVTTEAGETIDSDGVIVTTPAHRAAPLITPVDDAIGKTLSEIEYAASAVAHLAYRRADVPHPLDAFGFVVPAQEKRSIIAGTFTSTKYVGRCPEGKTLIRVFLGGALHSNAIPDDDDALFAGVRNDLRDLLGIEVAPLFTTLRRCGPCMPQYKVGHLDRIATMREQLAQHHGLELAGSAYEGVGIPDCIHNGESAAHRMLGQLKNESE